MADEKEDPASRYRAYLKQWIERDNRQRTLRPVVVRALGTGMWQEDAMRTLRAGLPQMAAEVDGDIERSFAALKEVLPLPVSYEPTTTLSSSAVAVTSNAKVFEALVSAQTTEAEPLLKPHIQRYEALVAEQGREEEAGRRVALLFPELAPRFAEVRDLTQVARGNLLEEERAALAMRTFLHKLKGELFSKAGKHMGENMTWSLMAARLGRDHVGRGILLEQEATHASISDTLSRIGKARPSAFAFSQATTRFVDHVFVVCGETLAGRDVGNTGLNERA